MLAQFFAVCRCYMDDGLVKLTRQVNLPVIINYFDRAGYFSGLRG